jgi:AcrR family transcriptional regulator
VPDRKSRTPQQARSRATVDVILIAAAHILKTEGPARVSTNRVAELAGVSVGSLYQYFRNKQEMLDALRERYANWFDQAVADEMAKQRVLPMREAVRSAVEHIVAIHRLDPVLHVQLLDGAHPYGPDETRELHVRMQAYLEENATSLRPIKDPALVSYITRRIMDTLLHGTASDAPEWLAHPNFTDEVTELLVRYLAR